MNPVEAVDRFVFGTLFRKDINPPGPQEYWTNPAGDKIDFTFTFTANSSITISWKKCNNSQSDLWLTSFNYFEYPYSQLLAKDQNLGIDNSYQTVFAIPAQVLTTTAKFVLRFKPKASPPDLYDSRSAELSSRGFIVVLGNVTNSACSSIYSSSPPFSSATPVTPLPSPTTSLTISSQAASNVISAQCLSTGEKAGIIASTLLGAFILIVIAYVSGRFGLLNRCFPCVGGRKPEEEPEAAVGAPELSTVTEKDPLNYYQDTMADPSTMSRIRL